MRTVLSRFSVLLACFGVACGGAPAPPEAGELPLDEIRGEQIAAHLKFLSHDLLEGRAPSTRGGALAAEYLATQLAVFGVEPAGESGTYFQQLSIIEATVEPSFVLSVAGGPRFRYLDDVVAVSGIQRPKVTFDGDVVFVGHGIVAPELKWDDYAGVEMTGRIALVMVNDPPAPPDEPQLFGGEALTYYGRWTYKLEEAARQGALGAILIHTTESATYPWQVVQTSWSGTQYALPVREGELALALESWVTEDAARVLARHGGHDLDALRKTALQRGAKPVPLGVRVSGVISQTLSEKTTPNVIGVVRGNTAKDQGVMYTAHYDHLGMTEPVGGKETDRIHNGAIDNAAGVAGVLEIAEAFARARARPHRSIYFVFTAAEESGLLGAEHLAAHLPLPADQWTANINIDGLNLAGRTKDVVLLGAERSSLGAIASELASRHARVLGPDPEPGRGYFFRSDHFPLAKVGIPAVSLGESTQYIGKDPGFAKKLRDEYNEKDYHQPTDEFKTTWDYSGAVEDLRFLAELGWRISDQRELPAYNAGDQFAAPRAGK